jgi:two-component system CheB/CheR fusion protein
MSEGQDAGLRDLPARLPFPIVGIGASAGGLEAFTQLLSNLQPRTGMAFILVQHLDPRHESKLSEILGKATWMPVQEVKQGQPIEPNNVYIIPPNATIALADGILQVLPREGKAPHLPVDRLFRSLAEEQGSSAIGVVLSGTGSDGTQGICEIKAVGGITFAQNVRTAAHDGMPRAAIESGSVDFVMSPEEIGLRLGEVGAHPYLAPNVDELALEPSAEETYQRILTTIRGATNVDFSLYRDTTIRRRIMRRMALHSQQSLADYANRLLADRSEVEALYRDLLINVTSFFRDPEMFESLKLHVFPDLLRSRPAETPIRIWVPGCSTGQEAYSLAMALVEFCDDRPLVPPIQIFATDLSDQTALEKARAGVYPEGIEVEVSPERLRRFFRKEDHTYRIEKSIRERCVFARHNVTSDPPFSHIDLISCRNVLIYLTTALQRRIMPTFHYALNLPGYLVLGSAETVGEHTELFEVRDRVHRIYAKRPTSIRHPVFFPAPDSRLAGTITPGSRQPQHLTQDFQREADRILLTRYAPPGVVVNENFEILQFRGHTSLYLESPPGEPTTNLLKMAREGLFLDLRSALTEARGATDAQRREHVRVRTDLGMREIAIEVIPVRPPGAAAHFIVLFQEAPAPPEVPSPEPANSAPTYAESIRDAAQLRQELSGTREYLQSMIDQQDASNEELRSANEEILSSNEELQSTNEELETAKEELQSANEELTTVNEQLQRRMVELDLANNDLSNLFTSTSIPVVMVDSDLRIRRITGPAKKAMNLLPSDVGRPVSDLNLSAMIPDLDQVVADVIERVRTVERDVQDREGRWYLMRVHPYRTAEQRIEGVVIVLLDVDQIRGTRMELAQATSELAHQVQLIELSLDAVIVRDANNIVQSWNRGAQEMYGWTAAEAKGKALEALLRTAPAAWAILNQELDRNGEWEGELHQFKRDGTPVVVHSREVLVRDERGNRSAVLAIKRDITQLREAIAAHTEADRRKDEFMATLAHELRNPLAPVRNAVEIMRIAGDNPAAMIQVRDMLDRQVQQLSRIVDDLIDVSRIVEKKIELQRERIALSQVVDTALETCRSRIEGRRQKLTVSMPARAIHLDADPVRLSQILINLLDNASKYTDEGGQIWLSAEAEQDGRNRRPGAHVTIKVRDNGIGIAASLLPTVFDMFTQGARTRAQGRGGLGIGLALVRSLVEMHQGSIDVESEGLGHGTQFILRLPFTLAQEEAAPSSLKALVRKTPASARLLVVDDNTDHAQSLSMLLSLMGNEVQIAASGPEALEAVARFTPDVALIDIGLPGMSGYDVARRIREQPKYRGMVLVAQTGWGQNEDRIRSNDAGFDHHLVKPVSRESLESILASLDGKEK